ncbi:MAG: murein L,D-transpeptidase catalytic domain family protein [Bdellovibrio sp.]|nr:murein L,D-transpeptidase catalytic domain family protein [Bdellovibrio sp.]
MKNSFTALLLLSALVFANVPSASMAAPSSAIVKKILAQGVPAEALTRMITFMDDNRGRTFNQDTYTCEGRDPENVRPCEEHKRRRNSKTVTVNGATYVAIVDFGVPSSQRRFYFINLKTGAVQKYYAAHGQGSGKGEMATRFSNVKDSRQTSLGMYLTGETYSGGYGMTLRMYGLERSNDQAYNRDIVMHGAWYVSEDFMNSINRKTGQKYGRMGLSWGCPAVSLAIAERTIPYLKKGSLILHYHPSMSGGDVKPRISTPVEPTPPPQETADSEFDGPSPEYIPDP